MNQHYLDRCTSFGKDTWSLFLKWQKIYLPQILHKEPNTFTETLLRWPTKWVWCSQTGYPPHNLLTAGSHCKMSKQPCRLPAPLKHNSTREGYQEKSNLAATSMGTGKGDGLEWFSEPAEHQNHLRIAFINFWEHFLGCSSAFDSAGPDMEPQECSFLKVLQVVPEFSGSETPWPRDSDFPPPPNPAVQASAS